MHRTHVYFAVLIALLFAPSVARAATVQLHPTKDNSIFSEQTGNSAGAAYTIYTGRSGGTNGTRRALIQFDIAGNVPSGATIISAQLDMFVEETATQDTSPTRSTSLYLLTADWGEGTSFSGGNHGIGTGTGMGAAATTGDATWLRRFFNTTSWITNGGDFVGTASATHAVGQASISTPETWLSAGMASDVQLWLDTPAQNFGWIIRGDEATTFTTRRFFSRDWQDATNFPGLYLGPVLTVEFEETSTVPEPSTWALLALGGAGIFVWRRSRKSPTT